MPSKKNKKRVVAAVNVNGDGKASTAAAATSDKVEEKQEEKIADDGGAKEAEPVVAEPVGKVDVEGEGGGRADVEQEPSKPLSLPVAETVPAAIPAPLLPPSPTQPKSIPSSTIPEPSSIPSSPPVTKVSPNEPNPSPPTIAALAEEAPESADKSTAEWVAEVAESQSQSQAESAEVTPHAVVRKLDEGKSAPTQLGTRGDVEEGVAKKDEVGVGGEAGDEELFGKEEDGGADLFGGEEGDSGGDFLDTLQPKSADNGASTPDITPPLAAPIVPDLSSTAQENKPLNQAPPEIHEQQSSSSSLSPPSFDKAANELFPDNQETVGFLSDPAGNAFSSSPPHPQPEEVAAAQAEERDPEAGDDLFPSTDDAEAASEDLFGQSSLPAGQSQADDFFAPPQGGSAEDDLFGGADPEAGGDAGDDGLFGDEEGENGDGDDFAAVLGQGSGEQEAGAGVDNGLLQEAPASASIGEAPAATAHSSPAVETPASDDPFGASTDADDFFASAAPVLPTTAESSSPNPDPQADIKGKGDDLFAVEDESVRGGRDDLFGGDVEGGEDLFGGAGDGGDDEVFGGARVVEVEQMANVAVPEAAGRELAATAPPMPASQSLFNGNEVSDDIFGNSEPTEDLVEVFGGPSTTAGNDDAFASIDQGRSQADGAIVDKESQQDDLFTGSGDTAEDLFGAEGQEANQPEQDLFASNDSGDDFFAAKPASPALEFGSDKQGDLFGEAGPSQSRYEEQIVSAGGASDWLTENEPSVLEPEQDEELDLDGMGVPEGWMDAQGQWMWYTEDERMEVAKSMVPAKAAVPEPSKPAAEPFMRYQPSPAPQSYTSYAPSPQTSYSPQQYKPSPSPYAPSSYAPAPVSTPNPPPPMPMPRSQPPARSSTPNAYDPPAIPSKMISRPPSAVPVLPYAPAVAPPSPPQPKPKSKLSSSLTGRATPTAYDPPIPAMKRSASQARLKPVTEPPPPMPTPPAPPPGPPRGTFSRQPSYNQAPPPQALPPPPLPNALPPPPPPSAFLSTPLPQPPLPRPTPQPFNPYAGSGIASTPGPPANPCASQAESYQGNYQMPSSPPAPARNHAQAVSDRVSVPYQPGGGRDQAGPSQPQAGYHGEDRSAMHNAPPSPAALTNQSASHGMSTYQAMRPSEPSYMAGMSNRGRTDQDNLVSRVDGPKGTAAGDFGRGGMDDDAGFEQSYGVSGLPDPDYSRPPPRPQDRGNEVQSGLPPSGANHVASHSAGGRTGYEPDYAGNSTHQAFSAPSSSHSHTLPIPSSGLSSTTQPRSPYGAQPSPLPTEVERSPGPSKLRPGIRQDTFDPPPSSNDYRPPSRADRTGMAPPLAANGDAYKPYGHAAQASIGSSQSGYQPVEQAFSPSSYITPAPNAYAFQPTAHSPEAITTQLPPQSVYNPSSDGTLKSLSEDPLGRGSSSAKRVPCVSFGPSGEVLLGFQLGGETPASGLLPAYGDRSSLRSIEVKRLTDLLPVESELSPSSSWPGPLLLDPSASKISAAEKKKRDAVIAYLDNSIQEIETGLPYLTASNADSDTRNRQEALLLIMSVVRLILKADGKAPLTDSTARADLLDLLSQHSAKMNMDTSFRQPAPAKEMIASQADLKYLSHMLVRGQQQEAQQYAMQQQLWTHALIISSALGADSWKSCVDSFLAHTMATADNGLQHQPLLTAYKLFGGAADLAPSAHYVKDWRDSVATVTANTKAGDVETLARLGDQLMALKLTQAAHLCYLLSPKLNGWASGLSKRFTLLGCDGISGRSRDLELSELLEYALSFRAVPKGGEAFTGVPHLLPLKLQKAWEYHASGQGQMAQKYLDAVHSLSRAHKPPLAPGSALLRQYEALSARMSGHDVGAASGRKSGKPHLENLGSWFEGRLTKFIAGDEDPNAAAAPAAAKKPDTAKAAVGPFSHYSAISSPDVTPNLTRATSSYDLRAPRSTTPGPNAYRSGSAMSYRPQQPSMLAIQRPTSAASYRGGGFEPLTQAITEQPTPVTRQDSFEASRPVDEPPVEAPEPVANADEVAPQVQLPSWGQSYDEEVEPTGGEDGDAEGGDFVNPMAGGGFINPMQSYMPAPLAEATPSPAAVNERHDPFEDEDDDLGLGNSSSKKPAAAAAVASSSAKGGADKKDQGSTSAYEPKPAAKEEKEPEKKSDPPKAANTGSWLGRLWGGKKEESPTPTSGPVKAKLGEESNFYYDKEQKRWINKSAGATETPKAAPPPPPASRKPTPAPPSAAPSPAPSMGGGGPPPPASAPGSGPPTRPPTSNAGGPPPPPGMGAGLKPPGMAGPPRPASASNSDPPLDPLAAPPRKPAGKGKKDMKSRYVNIM